MPVPIREMRDTCSSIETADGDVTLQIRVEAINALNYTVLWNPVLNPRQANFGLVTQDRNNPRDIQLAAA